MRILKWLFIVIFFINASNVDGQWCCLDSTLLILDKTTVSLRLLISGASNNNLSSPNQGVCGVRIIYLRWILEIGDRRHERGALCLAREDERAHQLRGSGKRVGNAEIRRDKEVDAL